MNYEDIKYVEDLNSQIATLQAKNKQLEEQVGYFNNWKSTIEDCVEILAETQTDFESQHIGERRFGGISDLQNLCDEYRLMRSWDTEGTVHETGRSYWAEEIVAECENIYGDELNWHDFNFCGFEEFINWLSKTYGLKEAYKICVKDMIKEDQDFIDWEDWKLENKIKYH